MVLSDSNILEYIARGDIDIDPFEEKYLQPASVDLRLGSGFLEIDPNQVISSTQEVKYRVTGGPDFIVLAPGQFVLATTQEWVELSGKVVGRVNGKSSWGRRGLKIENAGFIDPGFRGNITLELLNEGNVPILLRVGEPICQIEFIRLMSPCRVLYHGKYVGQTGVTGAKPERS